MKDKKISIQELTRYRNVFGFWNKVLRLFWWFTWLAMFKFSPKPLFWWRRILVKVFGGTISKGVRLYPSIKIWAPWNISIGGNSWVGPGVDLYSVGKIKIGENVVISQGAYICSATHNFRDSKFPLVVRKVEIGDSAWIAAQVFVGPGVEVGEGAVLGARSVVFKDVPSFSIMVGNPAVKVGERVVNGSK